MNVFKSRHRTRAALLAEQADRSRAARTRDQLRDPLTSVLMSAMR
jgi:hypothetical protein